MRSTHRFGLALVLACVAWSTPGLCEDAREQSRAAFRRGVTLAKDQKYPDARDAFAEAYRLFPHPSILLNLGIARAKTGELVEAEQDLVKFLADDGGATAEELKSAQKTLADIREKLGTLVLSVKPASAKATLDGRPIALVAGQQSSVRATVGRHTLKVEAEGHTTSEQTVEIAPKSERPQSVELVAIAQGPKPPVDEPPTDQSFPTRKQLGIGFVGLGVAFAGAGSFFGIRAIMIADYYNAHPSEHARQDFKDDRDKGELYRTLSDVSFIAAIVSAGVGGYLIFVKPSKPAPANAKLVVGPSYAGLAGSF